MAYPTPNTIFVTSPATQKTEEIRLLESMASGGFDGFTAQEAEQFTRAKNIADPRYGDDPEGAIKYLQSEGWQVRGKFHPKGPGAPAGNRNAAKGEYPRINVNISLNSPRQEKIIAMLTGQGIEPTKENIIEAFRKLALDTLEKL